MSLHMRVSLVHLSRDLVPLCCSDSDRRELDGHAIINEQIPFLTALEVLMRMPSIGLFLSALLVCAVLTRLFGIIIETPQRSL